MFKWQICYETQRRQIFTVRNKPSKVPPPTSVHFATLVQKCVLFVWVDLLVSLSWQQHPKWRASNSSGLSTFVLQISPFIQPHKKKKNLSSSWRFQQFCNGKHTESDTCCSCLCEVPSHHGQYNASAITDLGHSHFRFGLKCFVAIIIIIIIIINQKRS